MNILLCFWGIVVRAFCREYLDTSLDNRDPGVLLENSPVHHNRLQQQQRRHAAAANAEGSPHLGSARSLSPVRHNMKWVSLFHGGLLVMFFLFIVVAHYRRCCCYAKCPVSYHGSIVLVAVSDVFFVAPIARTSSIAVHVLVYRVD